MSSAFWIILTSVAAVLGGISLGAYLVAARKLYSKDKQTLAHRSGDSLSEDVPAPKEKGQREDVL
jgi:hypothetical protein